MRIEDLLPEQQNASITTPKASGYSVPVTDVNFFNSLIDDPIRPTGPVPAALGKHNILAQASAQLNQSTDQLAKHLNAFSKKNSEELALTLPGQFSHTVLLSHVLVKTLGKTVQGIEKISNLQ